MSYITVYEGTRQWLHDHSIESTIIKSFIAGGCASVASQSFVVPLDIITQHLMLLGAHSPMKKVADSHTVKPGHMHLNTLNIQISNSGSRLVVVFYTSCLTIKIRYSVVKDFVVLDFYAPVLSQKPYDSISYFLKVNPAGWHFYFVIQELSI